MIPLIVSVCTIDLAFPENGSLKEKRRVLKSMIDRLHRRFNVAVAEVGGQDLWQRAVLGVACVSNSQRHADQVLNRVVEWVEASDHCVLSDYSIEHF